ncbi:TPA: hypothetical protein NV424_001855 [Citrobacter freundii]|nr:hypothetical protein [Citrobacter freundii]
MKSSKESEFAFRNAQKANLVERIRLLADRHKSIRAAAREWGLPFSTLNNYINRGTEPSFFAMHNISTREKVSMEWLASGSVSSFEFSSTESDRLNDQPIPGRDTWLMIFDNLEPQERKNLINYCLKSGAPSLAKLASKASTGDMEFIALSENEKERVMRLYEQIKKGSFEADSSIAADGPLSDSKKAV